MTVGKIFVSQQPDYTIECAYADRSFSFLKDRQDKILMDFFRILVVALHSLFAHLRKSTQIT